MKFRPEQKILRWISRHSQFRKDHHLGFEFVTRSLTDGEDLTDIAVDITDTEIALS